MEKEKILVIGSRGQIGSSLVPKLQEIFGNDSIVPSDLRFSEDSGLFEQLDATDVNKLAGLVVKHRITQIYHLAAILSAKGEADPVRSWDLNMKTLLNVLEVARELKVHKVFAPSSIAVFGEGVPRQNTPQAIHLLPSTVYGVSKVAAECWGLYYYKRYGVDVRSLRYPGVVGYESLPGGGTTDYAVDMFHKAVSGEPYSCYLKEDSKLPMIYMDDAVRATIELMEAPADALSVRSAYNLSGLSFSPAELASEISTVYPGFKISYHPDFRQQIADSWPETIDDSEARRDWGWKPAFDLKAITATMIKNLNRSYHTL